MKLLFTAKESNSVELNCDQPPALCWLSCQPFGYTMVPGRIACDSTAFATAKAAVVVALDVIPVLNAAIIGIFRVDFHKWLGIELAQKRHTEPLRVNTITRSLAP